MGMFYWNLEDMSIERSIEYGDLSCEVSQVNKDSI